LAIADIESALKRQILFIGDNPYRSGLKETPKRIVKMWGEIFAGYGPEPDNLVTMFPAEGYDGIVLEKDIDLFSMCEHHMLPFVGLAHVAYIPGKKKIIGASKLARIVDYYAQRLQTQERIGRQVTEFIMSRTDAKAAACIIEAFHYCMRMRGVSKQRSVLVTSSLRGRFRRKWLNPARDELMSLVNKK
jgi:GTP cyclohydrolase I